MADSQEQQSGQSQDTPKKKNDRGTQQKAQKSNEVTERERVHDKTYVEQITEKTEKH